MEEKKNIDRLFQEQFKDYEILPDDKVWTKIEADLKKKKKRRIIPIWWRIGGAAAAVVLLFSIGYQQFTSTHTELPLHDPKKQQVVETDLNPNVTTSGSEDTTAVTPFEESITTTQKDSDTRTDSKSITESSKKKLLQKSATSSIAEASTLSNKDSKTSTENNAVIDQNAIAETELNEILKSKKARDVIKSNPKPTKNNMSIAENTTEEALDTTINEKEKESIEEAIAAAEQLQEVAESNNEERWSIAPNIAPVYFNSLGEGSAIHNQFNQNNTGSDVSISYGIAGSYKVNKRLKVRAGVNRVNFNYATNDVIGFATSEIISNSNGSGIANIKLNDNAQGLTLMSSSAMNRSSVPETLKAQPSGQIQQQFGFIELPIALEYRVIDKNFGVNLVGGFSTFFLNDNEISAVFEGTSNLIGEASNINSTSYSANFGIGFDYGLTKQLNVMLEPTFKYQINTFNNTFGDFQPFFIGVYTGLSFKF